MPVALGEDWRSCFRPNLCNSVLRLLKMTGGHNNFTGTEGERKCAPAREAGAQLAQGCHKGHDLGLGRCQERWRGIYPYQRTKATTMDGNGEGMVAVVQGLRDAGLAVTLMSKRCASQERKVARILAYNNQSLLHTKSSVETNTHNGYDRCHAGVQICDDRYASSYQLAHCRMSPTSPPVRLSEFPPQRSQPNRTQGHFEIGGIGSGELTYNPIRTQYSFRSSLRWAERRPVQFSRASCQTDPFVHSLRRYPGLPPSRSISADLIERLIKHTQGKSVTKPSKTSKSMRSIPKDKSEEQTNRRERRSKNIQTYTRTKNEDRSKDSEGYVRKERSLKLSFSGERKHRKNKDSPINTTYDYFKGSTSLYRKRRDRFTDVRYLDNLTKYIKDTLQQICDDKPVICPNIQSRYHQHRKNFHHDQSSHKSYNADDQAQPSDSQGSPSTSLELRPGTCRKDCPRGSKICDLCRKPLACPCTKNPQTEAATSSPSLPTASKFCQCLPENIVPGKRKNSKDQASICFCSPDSDEQTRPGFDQKLLDSEKSLGYDQKVNDEVLDWIRALPVKAGDTSANVAARERIGKELADALKNIARDDDYNDNVINEVKKYLDKLPIWLPDNKAAQEAFKDLMAKNLLDKLKKIPDQSSHLADAIKKMVKDIDLNDQFADTIEKWVKDINFKKDSDKDKIAGDFINKLRPIALSRPKNNYDYAKILKEAICDMLEDLPIDSKGDKQETINELADKLVDTLVSLPDLPKKADRFADTVKEWVNDMKFKREIDKSQVARDFINKLKPIALNRPENKYEYAQKLNDAIKDMLEVLPLDIKGDKENEVKELANKLIDQLVSLPKDAVTPEDMVKPFNEVVDIINDWLDEDFPFMKDSKAVEDLAKKLHELQAKGVDDNVIEEMRNVIQDFLKNVLDIKDPETLDRLTNKLLRQFLGDDIMATSITPRKNREEEVEKIYQDVYNWMKNQPELSHLDPEKIKELSRELANKIYDNKIAGNQEINMSDWLKRKLSDIGKGQTVQEEERKRKLVLNEIDDFLAAATTDLPSETKQELEEKLADMLIKNVDEIINYEVDEDLLEDETDRLIDKLFEGVKNIYAPDQPEIKVKIPKETKDTLQEEIDNILDNTTADIKDKDALKTDLINTLVEGIRKGENENELKKEIYDELRAANLSEDEANKIAQNLFDKAKDMTLALRSQDSRMNHKRRLSKAEPSKLRKSINYQQEDNIFVPNDVLKLDKKKKSGSNAGIDAANKLEISKQYDDPMSEELLQQMKEYNIDPNDKEAVARFKNALQESKQGKRPLDKLIASIEKYSNLPKVPRKDKSKVSPAPEYTPSLTTSYSGVQNELINTSSGSKGPSLSSDEDARSKAKAQIKREPEDKVRQLSEERRKKLDRIDDADADKKRHSKVSSNGTVGSVGSSVKNRPGSPSRSGSLGQAKRDSLDSKTKQEIKQSLKGGVHDILDNAKINVNDREDLELKLNNLLNRLAVGDVDDVTDDVYKLLRNANIPDKQARNITNKLLNKTQSMSEAAAQKIKAGPLKGRSLDSKTKQEITQTVNDHIKDVLDNINAEIDDRDDLEVKLNTLLNKFVVGDRDDVKDDVYKLLRKANIPGEEAKPVTSRLIDKAKDLSESIAQKLKARPSKSRPLDAKMKEEIKQSLKGDIEKALDNVKTKIDDRENLESNLLNTILDQVEGGDVEAVRDDVFKLLRKSKIPGEESKTITNKLMGKAKDLSEVVAQKTKAGPSRKPLDSKTKEDIKQSLKGDIQKTLDKVKTKIDDRENLESNLLNTILDQVEAGDVEDIRDDVHKLLRNANIHPEEAKSITNKLISKAKDLSEVVAQKTKAGPSRKPLDSKTKEDIKQSLKGDIQKTLDKVKTKIDDRENLESNLLNTILDQVEAGDVEDIRDDVHKLLRNANIHPEEAKNITNKLISKAQDLSEVVAQKAKAGPSREPLDSKTKEDIKQTLKGDIQKTLDRVKTKIDDRENLESNLLNTILDQVKAGDVEDIRDDVHKLLCNANIHPEEAKNITNKLISKAKDLSEDVAQKAKAGPSGKPLDFKTKEEIKQSLKGDIEKALNKVKTKIDDRENLESNLLNTILDQVEGGDVEDVRDDVYKMLRDANIPREEAKTITNKLIGKAENLSEVVAQKTKAEPSRKPLDFNTKEEIKQSLKGDIEKALNKVKTKIDDREHLESNLLNTILDQVEAGDVEDIRDDVHKLLRNANIHPEEAKSITNKLIGKAKDLSEVVAQKTKAGPSGKSLDSKTKEEMKYSLKGDIEKALNKVKTKIDDREHLESNLLNTILDQVEGGDVEDIRDDVHKLLRNANIHPEEAKSITNKLISKAKDLSEVVAQKTKAGPSGKPLDFKTKEEIKQSLKGDIKKALNKVKTKIDDRENLESNLLNTILDQVEGGDVEDVRDDVYKMLRDANIPREEAKTITNKLIGKGKDLSDIVDQRIQSRSETDDDSFEEKPGKAYAQKRRPDHLTGDKHTKMGRISSKEKDALRESIIGDVNDIVDGAPLPLSSRTKNVLKAKLSSALMKGLDAPYSKEDVKNKVLDILSEESIKLQGDGRPRTSSEKVGQKAGRKKDSTGGIKIAHASILQEISTALQDARTKIPKSKRHKLRNKLADIILSNLKSDLNNVRMKIVDLLTKETHLHRGVISDLSIDIIERIIDVIKACEIAKRRKTKNMIYSVQIESKKREGKRKNDGNASSDEDGPMSRSKSTVKHDSSNYSNFSKSISDNIDYTIAKEHINIPEHKIAKIKQKLEKFSPKDILAMIRGDKAIKNKILDIIINEIKLEVSDANELINGVIKRFSETDDSQYSATSSQMQDMKGYLKGEILGLLEKYNVKFNQEERESSMVGSISPSTRSEAPLTSTPKDGVESPQMINEPSLSTVYDVDETSEYTLKASDRINSAEYYNKVLEVVDDWVEELPVDLNDENYRAMMVKELAADIIERQKYLQLNPDAETSVKEELECLKYQVFRWMNNLFDVGDLTPMTPKIERLRDRINDINLPLFDKSSKRHRGKNITENNNTTEKNNSTEYNNRTEKNNSREYNDIRNSNGKERTSDAFIDKFEDWVDSLPTTFKNEEEKQQYENLKSELLVRLKELGPNASPQAIQNEINKFLRKAPLDPSEKIDLGDKIGELTRIVQTTQPSKMEAASFESKTGYKKLPNLLYDFIEHWCDSLPFDDSLDQDTIKNMKHSLANKILQRICQLNLNPEILNDDFLYEDVLRDEIDNLLSEIRNYIPIDDEQLSEFKVVLINKIMEAKLKTQNELAGIMYKQQLRDAVSRTLPPGLDLTSEDLISFEMLKDTVADAFINLNYSSNNEELRNKLSKKIADEVTRFCNSYLQRHPLAPLCSNKLNQDLYAALNNVSLPNDESMRSEVEHVRMKEVITDWVRGLPLAEQTPTGQSTLNKMISVLAKRLHDLENAAELSDSDHTEEMKKEIKKWLRKLPLLGGKDSIDHYAADLIDRLKNTEDSRKFDASTRLQLDAAETCPKACRYAIKERPKTPKPCADTCMFTPQFPSSLTREDREHLDRIRERVNQARSKLAKRPCRAASPSPCMDTGSQTDIRPFGAMKSIPSVCPGTFQRPYKSAASRLRESPSCHISGGTPRPEKPPCPGMYASPQAPQCRRRSDAASPCLEPFSPCNASYNDVQPQIIVKEYYWDSNGNSNHQIPCRSPCDTFPGSRDPRSPCSQPTPPCRGQYSQPHTVPQSPQISSSDQENRRPRPEPGTSRCYKERVTRLGSLDDVRGQNSKDKQSENLDWNSVRFPEDDDFWGPCSRPIILSDDDFGPFSRERERKEERVRCRCRERVLTKCATKRRNRLCGSCNSSNNDPTKRCCNKSNPVQCPHPSYMYFRK